MAKLKGQLFARLALDYFDHPKIARLSPEAVVAHLEMLVYSRKYLTDGVIPMRIAMRYALHVVDELASNDPVNPSVIKNEDGSLILHGYSDFQETREEVESRRSKGKQAAQSRWTGDATSNAKSNASSNAKPNATSNTETETETENIKSDSSGEEPRPDTTEILDYLDTRLEGNGLKKPNRVQSNLRAARLLLDRDGHTVDDVKRIIDFAQDTEFWIPNIRSMSKLREKWDQLSAQAGRSRPVQEAFDPWNTKGPF